MYHLRIRPLGQTAQTCDIYIYILDYPSEKVAFFVHQNKEGGPVIMANAEVRFPLPLGAPELQVSTRDGEVKVSVSSNEYSLLFLEGIMALYNKYSRPGISTQPAKPEPELKLEPEPESPFAPTRRPTPSSKSVASTVRDFINMKGVGYTFTTQEFAAHFAKDRLGAARSALNGYMSRGMVKRISRGRPYEPGVYEVRKVFGVADVAAAPPPREQSKTPASSPQPLSSAVAASSTDPPVSMSTLRPITPQTELERRVVGFLCEYKLGSLIRLKHVSARFQEEERDAVQKYLVRLSRRDGCLSYMYDGTYRIFKHPS